MLEFSAAASTGKSGTFSSPPKPLPLRRETRLLRGPAKSLPEWVSPLIAFRKVGYRGGGSRWDELRRNPNWGNVWTPTAGGGQDIIGSKFSVRAQLASPSLSPIPGILADLRK